MSRWYYNKKGRAVGPLSLDDIKGLIRSGELRGHELVYRDGKEDWKRAFDWVELSGEGFSPQRSSLSRLIALPDDDERLNSQWIALIRDEGYTDKMKATPEKVSFRQEGPFTSDEIKTKLIKGELQYSDHLWRGGFEKWTPIFELSQFAEEFLHLKEEERESLKEVVESSEAIISPRSLVNNANPDAEKPLVVEKPPVTEKQKVEPKIQIRPEPRIEPKLEVTREAKIEVPRDFKLESNPPSPDPAIVPPVDFSDEPPLKKKFPVLPWAVAAISMLLVAGIIQNRLRRTDMIVENAVPPVAEKPIAPPPAKVAVAPPVERVEKPVAPPKAEPPPRVEKPEVATTFPHPEGRVEFLDLKDPGRLKLRVSGPFRAQDKLKVRLQARPGDVLGRVAHQIEKTWVANADGQSEVSLGEYYPSKGRYTYRVTLGTKTLKGTIEVGSWELSQLKGQQKKNAYFVQTERKRLWQALNYVEQSQRKKAKVPASVIKRYEKYPELREIQKTQNSLAFPDAWLDFSKILNSLQGIPARGLASIDTPKSIIAQVEAARKKMRLDWTDPNAE